MNSDFTTFDGQPLALCLTPPNYAVSPELILSVDRALIVQAISARESRRRFARSALYQPSFTSWLEGASEVENFRLWLLRLKGERVGIPLWGDGSYLSTNATIGAVTLFKTGEVPVRSGAPWLLIDPSFTTYEIVKATFVDEDELELSGGLLNNWPAGTRLYPLLLGRYSERPQMGSVTPDKVSIEQKFKETSPYEFRLTPSPFTLPTIGANIAAFAEYKVWNIHPDWTRPLETWEVDILYDDFGTLREEQQYVHQQPVRRGFEMQFTCSSRAQMLAIERFFWDRYGPTLPFFLPTFRNDLELKAQTNSSLFTIENSRYYEAEYLTHPGMPYLAFVGPGEDGVIEPAKVTTIDISGVHLEHGLTNAIGPGVTRISHMPLVRFAEPSLTWTNITAEFARCTLKFIEVPDEYVTPNAELPERARVYHFTERRNPADRNTWVHDWFTSYEATLTYSIYTCPPRPFSHGPIPNSLQLDDKVDLTSFDFTGNPLRKILEQRLEGNLVLEIIDVNAAAPNDGSARIIFSGNVGNLEPNGRQWKAEVAWRKNVLDRMVPRPLKHQACNTTCYSEICGLKEADFLVSGNITYIDGVEIRVAAGAGKPVNWFAAGGKIRRGIGLTTYECRGILTSAPIDGGVRLIIDQPFYLASVGNAAEVVPTCSQMLDDSTGRSCIAWGNRINFRGFHYLPDDAVNPTNQSLDSAAGGKK